jgi:hypothetical protein
MRLRKEAIVAADADGARPETPCAEALRIILAPVLVGYLGLALLHRCQRFARPGRAACATRLAAMSRLLVVGGDDGRMHSTFEGYASGAALDFGAMRWRDDVPPLPGGIASGFSCFVDSRVLLVGHFNEDEDDDEGGELAGYTFSHGRWAPLEGADFRGTRGMGVRCLLSLADDRACLVLQLTDETSRSRISTLVLERAAGCVVAQAGPRALDHAPLRDARNAAPGIICCAPLPDARVLLLTHDAAIVLSPATGACEVLNESFSGLVFPRVGFATATVRSPLRTAGDARAARARGRRSVPRSERLRVAREKLVLVGGVPDERLAYEECQLPPGAVHGGMTFVEALDIDGCDLIDECVPDSPKDARRRGGGALCIAGDILVIGGHSGPRPPQSAELFDRDL